MSDIKPKLLIVEDDAGLQAQLKWAYPDFEVIQATDRASAIAALRSEEPGVVTLDLGLAPDPDGTSEGFAVLDEIMALKPDTKVIVASGHGARESALQAIETVSAISGDRKVNIVGFCAFYMKSFIRKVFNQFIDTLMNYLGRHFGIMNTCYFNDIVYKNEFFDTMVGSSNFNDTNWAMVNMFKSMLH